MVCAARAEHHMPWMASVQCRVALRATLHVGCIWGEAGALSEASVELPVFEFKGSGEQESTQQGGGWAEAAAEESGP